MIELDIKNYFFKTKIIYNSESIFDVNNCSSISFRKVKNKFNIKQFKCHEEVLYIIDLTQSLDTIWNNMNRNSHRNIKKAEHNGITITFNKKHQEFFKMFKDHLKAKRHLQCFNIHKLEDIKKYGTLVIAEYNDQIISGSVFLEDKNNIVYWITASYRYSQNSDIKQLAGNATYLIQWEIIKYAKMKGIKEYNLGSCGYKNRINMTLVQFKISLGGKPYTYYLYNKDYNLLYKLIRQIYNKYSR